LTAIFGPTKDNGEWGIKYSNELYTLYTENDIVTYIKIDRLRWAGQVIRLEEQSPARRVLVAVVEGRRQRGRPKLRWEDGVMEDARKREKLQECCKEQGQLTSEKGLGSKRAVVPMMMMMMMILWDGCLVTEESAAAR